MLRRIFPAIRFAITSSRSLFLLGLFAIINITFFFRFEDLRISSIASSRKVDTIEVRQTNLPLATKKKHRNAREALKEKVKSKKKINS